MTRHALIYARVSTQEQADSRLGLESQIARCHEFIERSPDMKLMKGPDGGASIVDSGVSGSVPLLSRPQGRHLLAASAYTIVALTQDRLFRSVADMLATVEQLAENAIDIVTVDEGPINFDDDDRWLGTMMRAVFGEFERRKARTRTRRGLEALRARGGKVGEAPYGWKNEGNGRHALDLEEQLVIKRILDMRGLSNREIARQLNLELWKTREGAEWTHTQVGRILQREGTES